MKHKNLREQDKVFLSKFDKILKNNTWREIRSVSQYVKSNNLSIKEVCEFLNWQVGDRKEMFQGREAQLIMIRQKKGSFLVFKYIEPTYECSEVRKNFLSWLGLGPEEEQ